jgi:ubiquinone/menaquinone biosynthesis C-methylase UbiE
MLGDVRGLRIADVGTGTGRHAVRFANGGAKVSALDLSRGMHTRRAPSREEIAFHS